MGRGVRERQQPGQTAPRLVRGQCVLATEPTEPLCVQNTSSSCSNLRPHISPFPSAQLPHHLLHPTPHLCAQAQ